MDNKATWPSGVLGQIGRRQVPDAVKAAWWEDLARWVHEIHDAYPYLWPDRPPEGTTDFNARSRKRAWPQCWRQHGGLVEYLVALKVWQEGLLESAEWAGGPEGWCRWEAFLDGLAVRVQIVSQFCSFGHRGKPSADRALAPLPAVPTVGANQPPTWPAPALPAGTGG